MLLNILRMLSKELIFDRITKLLPMIESFRMINPSHLRGRNLLHHHITTIIIIVKYLRCTSNIAWSQLLPCWSGSSRCQCCLFNLRWIPNLCQQLLPLILLPNYELLLKSTVWLELLLLLLTEGTRFWCWSNLDRIVIIIMCLVIYVATHT